MLLKAITLSAHQLFDARTFRLMMMAALTLTIFALLGLAGWQAMLRLLVPHFADWIGPDEAAGIALILTLLFGWFLFRAVAMAVMGLFMDGIVESVEEDHYPEIMARAFLVPVLNIFALVFTAALGVHMVQLTKQETL